MFIAQKYKIIYTIIVQNTNIKKYLLTTYHTVKQC